jgi:poly-gamma-glutamate synthesis protein (capsule biosynthesis protein)
LDALRTISTGLGLEQRRLEGIQMGFRFPPDDPELLPFLDANFRAGEQMAIETAPLAEDLEAICGWIREAKGRSDIVVVSLHGHEQGAGKEEPAEFIRTFALRAIEEGADVVVGHGPHLLRGMELYRGKPIFYSLGNFVGQNELTHKLPSDSYETFRIDASTHPGGLFRQRSQNDEKGFPSDRRFWQSLVPVCRWAEGRLAEIELHPVTLGLGETSYRRGRPRLAEGSEADEILSRFAALSETFGTRVEHDGEHAVVRLD